MNEHYAIITILIIISITCIFFKESGTQKSNSNKVIIIGGGLAGLSSAITILENGGNVILIEKQSNLGGNSAKASSGINGTYTSNQQKNKINDSIYEFYKDTLKSSNRDSEPYLNLIKQLTNSSSSAITWLEQRGVNLNDVAILGGHSNARTHRPNSNVLVGIEIISKLSKYIEKYSHKLQIEVYLYIHREY